MSGNNPHDPYSFFDPDSESLRLLRSLLVFARRSPGSNSLIAIGIHQQSITSITITIHCNYAALPLYHQRRLAHASRAGKADGLFDDLVALLNSAKLHDDLYRWASPLLAHNQIPYGAVSLAMAYRGPPKLSVTHDVLLDASSARQLRQLIFTPIIPP